MPKILVMGKDRDYHHANIDTKGLQDLVSKFYGSSGNTRLGEEILANIGDKESSIPAKWLSAYGGGITLKPADSKGTIAERLVLFFKEAENYADNHKAEYVVIQDLKIEKDAVSGIVTLYLE